MEDYVVRYGYGNKTNRTDYITKKEAMAFFEKLKRDSNVTWAELVFEPLDEEDTQYLLDEFEKYVCDFFGEKCVFNIG